MPVKIEVDLLTVSSFAVGVLGVLIAIYQIIKTQKARKVYESHCKSKCKSIVSLTKTMANEVKRACTSINQEYINDSDKKNNSQYNFMNLAMRINAMKVSTARLVDFCIEINDDHESQFGYKVYPNIEDELPESECLGKILRD